MRVSTPLRGKFKFHSIRSGKPVRKLRFPVRFLRPVHLHTNLHRGEIPFYQIFRIAVKQGNVSAVLEIFQIKYHLITDGCLPGLYPVSRIIQHIFLPEQLHPCRLKAMIVAFSLNRPGGILSKSNGVIGLGGYLLLFISRHIPADGNGYVKDPLLRMVKFSLPLKVNASVNCEMIGNGLLDSALLIPGICKRSQIPLGQLLFRQLRDIINKRPAFSRHAHKFLLPVLRVKARIFHRVPIIVEPLHGFLIRNAPQLSAVSLCRKPYVQVKRFDMALVVLRRVGNHSPVDQVIVHVPLGIPGFHALQAGFPFQIGAGEHADRIRCLSRTDLIPGSYSHILERSVAAAHTDGRRGILRDISMEIDLYLKGLGCTRRQHIPAAKPDLSRILSGHVHQPSVCVSYNLRPHIHGPSLVLGHFVRLIGGYENAVIPSVKIRQFQGEENVLCLSASELGNGRKLKGSSVGLSVAKHQPPALFFLRRLLRHISAFYLAEDKTYIFTPRPFFGGI